REIDAGNFSFAEFYLRRARRIFPAMFFVTGITLAIGTVLFMPEHVEDLSASAIATALFSANIYFSAFLDTGYFAEDSQTKPLLHMWSLGVEEQFYILWPAVLLLVAQRPSLARLILGCLIVLSVLLGELLLATERFTFAYYMLPTRVFELGAGAYLALSERAGRGVPSPGMAFVLGIAGLVAVFGSAAMLNEARPFPGFNAVPVTVGTVLLLISGRCPDQPVARLLSLPPMRWIGFISFSLYLWHWPILAVQRYFDPNLGAMQQVVSLVGMVLLAAFTYRYVETPLRARKVTAGQVIKRYFLLPTSVILALGIFNTATRGVGPWIFGDYAERLAETPQPAFKFDFICQRPTLTAEITSNPDCLRGPDNGTGVLLYGDSNAAHFVGAFDVLSDALGFRFRNVAHSACPPIAGDTHPYTLPRYEQSCADSVAHMKTVLPDYDTVVLAALWAGHAFRGQGAGADLRVELGQSVDDLLSAGKRVILIGEVPSQENFDGDCFKKHLKLAFLDCEEVSVDDREPQISAALRDIAERKEHVYYVDPFPALCNDGRCPAYREGRPVYFDNSHLSMVGSRLVGDAWLAGRGADLDDLRTALAWK
ncbi:acyltransferase family protein, partial [Congregibacter sp.]|uniref:acyltransferase family protein n=1 Tax=Congregibacter sp. TaxID=2744308 RepID=UPI0038586101